MDEAPVKPSASTVLQPMSIQLARPTDRVAKTPPRYVTAEGTAEGELKVSVAITSLPSIDLGLNVGTTAITSGTDTRVLYDNAGVLGEYAQVPVANGGTGAASLTANGVVIGNGTSAVTVTAEGATGTVLHGNTGADPSFSAVSLTADVTGTLPVANGGTGLTTLPGINNFRLTGASGTPVTTSDVSNITTLYWTPFNGSCVSLYDGTRWKPFQLPEIGILLGTLTSSIGHDVFAQTTTATPSSTDTGTDILTFAADNWQTGAAMVADTTVGGVTAGTVYYYNRASSTTGSLHTTLANALAGSSKVDLTASVTASFTGISLELLAWSSGTARATAVVLQDGYYVKTGDAKRLLVGSFYTTSTTVTQDTARQRLLYNQFNQVERTLQVNDADADAQWTTTSATIRQANANVLNQVEVFCGLAGPRVSLMLLQESANSGANGAYTGFGINSITAFAASPGAVFLDYGASNKYLASTTPMTYFPALGFTYIAWLENGGSAGTTTFLGTKNSPLYSSTGLYGGVTY